MRAITLNDGTVLEGHVLENGDGMSIYVYLDGKTVIEGVLLFADSEKSCHIVANSYGHEHVYDGYTHLYSASHEYGNCNLVMRKEEQSAS